jgi:hypothetical protein
VTGRESWGAFVAIFVPLDGSGDLCQSPLRASGHEEASAELDRMDDRALGELLDQAVYKDLE